MKSSYLGSASSDQILLSVTENEYKIKETELPIYIHSLFRAGSTYLFHVFRRSKAGYWCYQEPLHEVAFIAKHNPDILCQTPLLTLSPLSWKSGKPARPSSKWKAKSTTLKTEKLFPHEPVSLQDIADAGL